jgi:hypothetical protein
MIRVDVSAPAGLPKLAGSTMFQAASDIDYV